MLKIYFLELCYFKNFFVSVSDKMASRGHDRRDLKCNFQIKWHRKVMTGGHLKCNLWHVHASKKLKSKIKYKNLFKLTCKNVGSYCTADRIKDNILLKLWNF